MNEWQEITLGDALDIRHGYAFKGEYFRDDGDLIVLTPGNFFDSGGFKPKRGKEKYYDGPYSPEYLLNAGDVVVAMTEQTQGLLGSTATIPESERYLHNQRIGLLRVMDPKTLDLRFCYHLLNVASVRQQIQATATGAKVRHTAPERIRAVRVRLPRISTQQAVAAVLDALDDLSENNRRRIDLLEQMARAIYREWFVNLRYPGHEDDRRVDSPLGPIPEGWEHRRLFDVADVAFGHSFKSKHFATVGPYAVVRIRDVPSGTTRTFTDEEVIEKYRVVDGDVLIGMDGEFHLHQWTGGVAWLNQRVARLRPLDGLAPRHLMLAIEAQIKAWNVAISGTTVAHLGKRHLEQVSVLVPSAAVLDLATRCFDGIAQQGCALDQSLRQLTAIRDLLLPNLVTGQISVLDLDAALDAAV